MIRVLQVFGTLGRGGLESFVMNLYRAIDRDKIQFDFLLTFPNGDYEEEARALGARIFYIPNRSANFKEYKDSLNAFFKLHSKDYSAIHLHASSLSSIDPLIYAKKFGIRRRIIHSHSSSVKHSVKARFVHRVVHEYRKLQIKRIATDYLGCSDKALEWMFSGTGIRDKAVMINNGIDSAKFAYNLEVRKAVRSEFGIQNRFVMGHVGSFIDVKNHRFLINLFSKLIEKLPSAILLLVGDGELKEDIRNQVKMNGLQDNVIFAGVRSDVNRLLQGMDILIMPSFFEGLPVSLVEAQASGLPVLASNTISQDVALTPNIKFLSLQSCLEIWIDEIITVYKSFKRIDATDFIRRNGFDIKDIVEKISTIYYNV